jgi:predicted amidohydrolase
VDPKGEVLVEASGHKEQIIHSTLDLSKIDMERRQEPVLRSLRRDIYGLAFDIIGSGQ